MIILKRTNQFIASHHWRPKLSCTSGFRYSKPTKLSLCFRVDHIEQIISEVPCESYSSKQNPTISRPVSGKTNLSVFILSACTPFLWYWHPIQFHRIYRISLCILC